jgi:hypothetical protein
VLKQAPTESRVEETVKKIPASVVVVLSSVLLVAAALVFIRYFFLKKPVEKPVEPSAGLARVTHFQGTVKIKRADRMDWKDVKVGEALSQNDKVKTWENATASIEFGNGSLINVKENSLIVIQELMNTDTSVEVLSGRVSAQVEELDTDQSFRIKAKFVEAKVLREEPGVD